MERLNILGRNRRESLHFLVYQNALESQSRERIQGVIAQVDAVLERMGEPRIVGSREGSCGLTSDLVRRAAKQQGMEADTLQVSKIHDGFGRWDGVFRHGFNVVRDRERVYLVDGSFCQFIDPETNEIGDGNVVSGSITDHPIALTLLEQGYVEFTDQSVRDYLRATAGGSKEYIDEVRAQDLLNNSSFTLRYVEDVYELDKYLSGKAIPEDIF